jgi:hypothetical protein
MQLHSVPIVIPRDLFELSPTLLGDDYLLACEAMEKFITESGK